MKQSCREVGMEVKALAFEAAQNVPLSYLDCQSLSLSATHGKIQKYEVAKTSE